MAPGAIRSNVGSNLVFTGWDPDLQMELNELRREIVKRRR